MDSTIRIIVDPSGAVQGTRVVDKSLQDIRGAFRKTDQAVKTSKEEFLGFGRSLVGALGITVGLTAVAAEMRRVIETGSRFTRSVSELGAITGASGQDLRDLASAARDIGRETTIGAAAAAEGFKLIASAKPDLLENRDALIAVTREAVTLAEAAGIALPEAAKALGGALNQFNADADQAGRFINVLAAGSQKGATEIPDLTESLRAAGAAASSLGLSFESTIAGIETLGEVNIKGAEAGTQFRNVLLALKQTGIDELDPSVNGLTGALANLNALELDSVQILKIFGRESFVAATALLERVDRQDELTDAITGTNTAQEQAAQANDNLEGDVARLTNALEDLRLTIFEGIEPGLRAFTTGLTITASALSTFIDAARDAIALTGLAGFSEVFGSSGPDAPVAEPVSATPEAAAATRRQPTIAANRISAVRSGLAGSGRKPARTRISDEERAAARAAEEQQRSFAGIRAELLPLVAAEEELNKAQGVLNEQFRLGKIDANQLQELHGLLGEQYAKELEALMPLNEEQKRQAQLLESIKGPSNEAIANIESLNALYADGKITVDEFNDSLQNQRLVLLDSSSDFADGVERGLIRANESIGDFADEAERGIARAFGGAEDAIANFVKTTELDFSGLVDSILEELLRLAIRQAILAPLSKAFQTGDTPGTSGGTGSGGGSTFGSLANIGISALSSFGSGGIQNTPTISGLAEKGPEAIIPLEGGSVPVQINDRGRRNIINMNFNIATENASSFRASQNQIMTQAGSQLGRVLDRNTT